MTTLKSIRRAMYLRPGSGVGQTEVIASLTTTTAVVSKLATGTINSEKYLRKWLIRAEAASQPADRERSCSAFSSSTGTFTHAGANYADTTATSE